MRLHPFIKDLRHLRMIFHPAISTERKAALPTACRCVFTGIERAIMKKESIEILAMWDRFREDDDMICDAPARKIGMPYPSPYSVIFPVEMDGELVFVDLNVEEVKRFAYGLLAVLPEAIELTNKAEAEYLTHEAISQAKAV
jgi:hypothetical protein